MLRSGGNAASRSLAAPFETAAFRGLLRVTTKRRGSRRLWDSKGKTAPQPLIPAKAGIRMLGKESPLDPRLRGDERMEMVFSELRRLDGWDRLCWSGQAALFRSVRRRRRGGGSTKSPSGRLTKMSTPRTVM